MPCCPLGTGGACGGAASSAARHVRWGGRGCLDVKPALAGYPALRQPLAAEGGGPCRSCCGSWAGSPASSCWCWPACGPARFWTGKRRGPHFSLSPVRWERDVPEPAEGPATAARLARRPSYPAQESIDPASLLSAGASVAPRPPVQAVAQAVLQAPAQRHGRSAATAAVPRAGSAGHRRR
jgi:hypothetical protein